MPAVPSTREDVMEDFDRQIDEACPPSNFLEMDWATSAYFACATIFNKKWKNKAGHCAQKKHLHTHTHTQKYTTHMQIGICPFVDFGLQIIPSSCHGLRVLPAIAAAPGKLHNGKASRCCVGQNVCIIYCGNVRISCLRWF